MTDLILRHEDGAFTHATRIDGTSDVHPRFVPYQSASDYMEPTLAAGDLAEIDTTDTRINEGVYLLRMPYGEPALRRLQPTLTGRVRVSCDKTPNDQDECDAIDLDIIGRVTKIWNGRRM